MTTGWTVTPRTHRPAMTEAELLAAVLDMAALFSWQCAHFRPALTSRGWRTPVQGTLGRGWPDLTLVRRARHPGDLGLLFAELKSDAGKLTADQVRVHETLDAAGLAVCVWRPADLDAGRIEAWLR